MNTLWHSETKVFSICVSVVSAYRRTRHCN